MPAHCEIIEVRNSADELGFPCSRTANAECSDCGSELCESHSETCGGCRSIFCPSCFLFHRAQHSKPAWGTSRAKKGVIYAAVIFNPNSCGESDRATQQVQRNRLIVFSRQEFRLRRSRRFQAEGVYLQMLHAHTDQSPKRKSSCDSIRHSEEEPRFL